MKEGILFVQKGSCMQTHSLLHTDTAGAANPGKCYGSDLQCQMWNSCYCIKLFFIVENYYNIFTPKKNTFQTCSLKGSLGNQKWFFYGIDVKISNANMSVRFN